MELHQLKIFIEVVRYKSMTKAAQKMYIAQSAVSQSISRLETELNVKLFNRVGRGIILSDCGKRFYKHIRNVLIDIDNACIDVQDSTYKPSGTLNLLVLSGSVLIPDLLSEYSALYPNVHFKLVLNNYKLIRNNDYWDYDLCISYMPEDETPDNAVLLLCEDIKLAIPKNHRFCCKEFIDLIETKDEDYICMSPNTAMRYLADRLFKKSNFDPYIVCESDSPAMVRSLIDLGLGLSLVPVISWKTIISDRIKLLQLEPPCTRSLYIFSPPERQHTLASSTFQSVAYNYFKKIKSDNS